MVLPAEVAFNWEVPPTQIVVGEAETGLGAAGKGVTGTETVAQAVLEQPVPAPGSYLTK